MYSQLALSSRLEVWLTSEISNRFCRTLVILSVATFSVSHRVVVVKMQKLGLVYLSCTTWVFLLERSRCDFQGRQQSRTVMLVLLAVWWSVSLERMKTGYTCLVLARQLVHATRNCRHCILVMKIDCYPRMVVNSGGEFLLREGGPLQVMK